MSQLIYCSVATCHRSVKMMQDNLKLPRLNKFNKIMQRAAASREPAPQEEDLSSSYRDDESEKEEVESSSEVFDTRQTAMRPRSNSHGGYKRLPPITEKKKGISTSQQNLSTVNLDDPEFRRSKKQKLYEKDKKEEAAAAAAAAKGSKGQGKMVTIKPSQSMQSIDESKGSTKHKSDGDGDKSPTRKKKDRNAHSAMLIAKVKTEGGSIPLPMHSSGDVPRPFIRSKSEDLTKVFGLGVCVYLG